MTLLKNIEINNFRVFAAPTKFNFRKITLLTGPNNSGKSSLIKALLLLKENLVENFYMTEAIEALNFKNGQHKLGSFDSCLNDDKNNLIEFVLPFKLINNDDRLIIRYSGNSNEINNGYLSGLGIFNHDHTKTYLLLEPVSEGWGFKLMLDFLAFYENLNKRSKMFGKLDKNPTFGTMSGRDFQKLVDPKKSFYSHELPIFDYKFIHNNKNDKSIFNKIDKAYLVKISKATFQQYHHDGDYPILKNLLHWIYNHYRGESGGSSLEYKEVSDEFSLKKISATENGMHFFDGVGNLIRKGFDDLVGNFQSIHYLNADKATQSRLYFDASKSPLSELLIEYHENAKSENHEFINKWLREFEIISSHESINFKRISDSGFEISIESKKGGNCKHINLADLGFGVTQILVLLLRFACGEKCIYMLEEPEINLHPNLQSKLADLFIEVVNKYHCDFIIETHSEYLIRKLQYYVATNYSSRKAVDQVIMPGVVIYYFNPKGKRGLEIYDIEINRDGRLTKEFGPGFLDESTRIIFDIWNLPGQN